MTDGRIHLLLNPIFFRNMSWSRAVDAGPKEGPFSWWYFVHEVGHAAELRYLARKGARLASDGSVVPNSARPKLYDVMESHSKKLQSELKGRGEDLQALLRSNTQSETVALRALVRSRGIPTLYSLTSRREGMVDAIATRLTESDFVLETTISEATTEFLSELRCGPK